MTTKKPATKARCPRCNVPVAGNGSGFYRCPKCLGTFDDDPDEGGDYSTDPSKRIEREDEQRARRGFTRRRR